jgi:periplasmic protein TonB
MTAATPGPSGPNLFSMFSSRGDGLYRTRREAFAFSLIGQVVILGLLVYFMSVAIHDGPKIGDRLPKIQDLPLVFSGFSGGGGGNHENNPASQGDVPKASLDPQIAPPTVILPKEMPKLPAPETIVMAPDVKLPQGGQIGDPMSRFTVPSNGPGGRGGIGTGCCDGDGSSTGPHVGDGPEGIYAPGRNGVSNPEAIYSPEPSFSDEARKAKHQGIVQLLLVVGKDGRPYGIRVGQTLGMGLDEKAIETVKLWRFRPATLNGQPVATQIAIQVEFHLY